MVTYPIVSRNSSTSQRPGAPHAVVLSALVGTPGLVGGSPLLYHLEYVFPTANGKFLLG